MQSCNNSTPAISVAICTYNRAELLNSALQTLCEQTINKSHYEVIVVDNNSKDSTHAVTSTFTLRYPNIRYCFEIQQGLSYARNRAWREAKGTYVAYVDDDCKIPKQWLTIAMKIIDQIAPAAFGGPYYAFYNSPKPYWWKDSYETYEQSQVSRPLRRLEYLRGGNIFFRRKVLDAINGFDVEFGMSGKKLGYGEETELQRRVRATMPSEIIYYDPKLNVFHLVRPEKMTWRYILNSRFAGGRHVYRMFWEKPPQESRFQLIVQIIITLFRLFSDILFGLLQRNRKRYPYLQNYLYEKTFVYVQNLGFIYERYIH